MSKKRRRGRPRIGKRKSYWISESEFMLFEAWCNQVLHKKVSDVVRGLICRTNKNIEAWAKELLKEKEIRK